MPLPTINELAGLAVRGTPQTKQEGKIDVLLRHAKVESVTDFVRKLLQAVADDHFLALVGSPRATVKESTLRAKIDSISRMLREQVSKNQLNREYEAAVFAWIGIDLRGDSGKVWREGTAAELNALLERRQPSGAATTPRQAVRRSDPSAANLISRRDGASWSLIESLCSIVLFGGEYEGTDLDFELCGQATRITIPDETGKRILLQRDVVVRHCVVDLHLGGAEIRGGLIALKRVVAAYLAREEAKHLYIEVGGSARAPQLIVHVREGALDVVRPLVVPPKDLDNEPQPSCWLTAVSPGTKVSARVRIFDSALQDYEPAQVALSDASGEKDEPAISRKGDRPLSEDERVRIMMHLWKCGTAAERNPDRREPGALNASYDARTFVERKHGGG